MNDLNCLALFTFCLQQSIYWHNEIPVHNDQAKSLFAPCQVSLFDDLILFVVNFLIINKILYWTDI